MNSRKFENFTRAFPKILTLAIAATLTAPAAAETSDDSSRINLLRPDRLLVQISQQDRAEVASDHFRLPVIYTTGQDRGYRDVSRSNLLNSPAARYFARKLTGSGRN